MIRSKIFLLKLFLPVTILIFLTSGCSDSTGPAQVIINPPTDANVTVDANTSGGSSFAIISWSASSNENDANFNGYRVVTYQLDNTSKIVSKFEDALVPKSTHSHYVNNIQRQVRYRSYISSVLTDGSKSDSASTIVYAGVYYNNDGVVDQDNPGDTTYKSGYGWNVNSGYGSRYAFVSKNASAIDIYCKMQDNQLQFFSPDQFLSGGKTTLFGVVGTSQQAFDNGNLTQPQYSNVDVAIDNVYLIQTKEGNYIKLWVKRIDVINSTDEVIFVYKVQPIPGLLIAKK